MHEEELYGSIIETSREYFHALLSEYNYHMVSKVRKRIVLNISIKNSYTSVRLDCIYELNKMCVAIH